MRTTVEVICWCVFDDGLFSVGIDPPTLALITTANGRRYPIRGVEPQPERTLIDRRVELAAAARVHVGSACAVIIFIVLSGGSRDNNGRRPRDASDSPVVDSSSRRRYRACDIYIYTEDGGPSGLVAINQVRDTSRAGTVGECADDDLVE